MMTFCTYHCVEPGLKHKKLPSSLPFPHLLEHQDAGRSANSSGVFSVRDFGHKDLPHSQ